MPSDFSSSNTTTTTNENADDDDDANELEDQIIQNNVDLLQLQQHLFTRMNNLEQFQANATNNISFQTLNQVIKF